MAAPPQEGSAAGELGRILVTKIGLDGHDRGLKVQARMLRDAGYEVIYTGLFQTPDSVVAAAVDEDVDAVGVSMLSGAHEALVPLVTAGLRAAGADIPVILGGIVPQADFQTMFDAGVSAVLTPGASSDDALAAFADAIAAARARAAAA